MAKQKKEAPAQPLEKMSLIVAPLIKLLTHVNER